MKGRKRKRRDDNHKDIEREFRNLGFSVLDVSQLGGCCDIFVSKRKITAAIEIKDGSKPPSQQKLTESEMEFRDSWRGLWFLVGSIDDVLEVNKEFK